MAADAGDLDGCVALADMWEKGLGVVLVSMTTGVLQQDVAEAVRLYKAAADRGHAEGQSNLGRMCVLMLRPLLLSRAACIASLILYSLRAAGPP
jgi:TPR repeat protein